MSAHWDNGARYSGAWRRRLEYVIKNIKSKPLIDHVTQVTKQGSNLVRCWTLDDKYTAGESNIIRRITCEETGQSIIARIRLPNITPFKDELADLACRKPMITTNEVRWLESEMNTMNYIRTHTSIPVPTILGHDLRLDSPVGFPYILMEYIAGSTAFELACAAGNPLTTPSEYLDHYYTQLADIHCQLARCQFSAIGGIAASGDNVDILGETGSGPFTDNGSFYKAMIEHVRESKPSQNQTLLDSLCESLVNTDDDQSEPTYGLVNLELGTHNVIVDSSFNILAVIDWDSTYAAPRAARHFFQVCVGAEPGIPGHGAIKAFGQGHEICVQKARLFSRCLETAATKYVNDTGDQKPLFTAREMFCKEALNFRALAYARIGQSWAEEEWIPGLQWLNHNTQEEVWEWYGV